MTENVEQPSFHCFAHHVLPPGRLYVSQVPFDAEHVDKQALGEPVLAHDPSRGRVTRGRELNAAVPRDREQPVTLHPGHRLRCGGNAVPEPLGDPRSGTSPSSSSSSTVRRYISLVSMRPWS